MSSFLSTFFSPFLSKFTFLSTFLSKFTFLSTFLSKSTFLSAFLSTSLSTFLFEHFFEHFFEYFFEHFFIWALFWALFWVLFWALFVHQTLPRFVTKKGVENNVNTFGFNINCPRGQWSLNPEMEQYLRSYAVKHWNLSFDEALNKSEWIKNGSISQKTCWNTSSVINWKRWNERKNRVMKKTINVKVFLQYEFNNEKIFLGFL